MAITLPVAMTTSPRPSKSSLIAEARKVIEVPALLERIAVSVLIKRALQVHPRPSQTAHGAHTLTDADQRRLRRLQAVTIARAAVAGALSALLASLAELTDNWWIFGGVLVGASALEIAFLYWDALRTIHRMAEAARLTLLPIGDVPAPAVMALARAALELPDPPRGLLGINAHRGVPRWRLVAATLLYKAKIGLTNFLVRALLRRLMGRAALRAWLVFVAVPITALWNAVVCWLVLREARLRVIGPSACNEIMAALLPLGQEVTAAEGEALLRALGCTIVTKRRFHPNLEALLDRLHERVGRPHVDQTDDLKLFHAALAGLAPETRAAVIKVLQAALVLDGRLTRADRQFLRSTRAIAGLPETVDVSASLRQRLLRGTTLFPGTG